MFIRSERLFLRPAFAEDWREIHAGICDEAVVRMLLSAPWPYRESDARAFAALPSEPLLPRCVITLPGADGAPVIGCIGLDRRADGVELGYWLARKHWGRGFATEAGRAMLASARAVGHRRVHAGHALDNEASARVLEKLGFRPTGEVRFQYSTGRGAAMATRRLVLDLDEAARNDPEPEMSAAA
ncbi:MAG: GNAT family N-acetyltransferase [Novosphingobium sp.]|nr:GNAT family N-acetyltransferase [Novosphingobium sp.]